MLKIRKTHKTAFALLSSLPLLFACAAKGPKAKYVEEKNQARFASSRSFAESPEQVLQAAREVLDSLTLASKPAATDTVKNEGNAVYTGWIYGTASRDKYVQYDFNDAPRRKDLAFRRIYGFTASPAVSGSHVVVSVEEEIQSLDMKMGRPEDWKRVEPEKAAYEMLLRKLQERLRAR